MKVEKVFLRTPYNYDRDEASDEAGCKCCDESLAKQSFAEECDINTIVKRFGLLGQLPQNVPVVYSGDFTGQVSDFHSAMNLVRAAEESFAAMPADVRSRFGNDPGAFVSFCSEQGEDGELVNLEEMRRLGLAVPKAPVVEERPVLVRMEAPVAPATSSPSSDVKK